MSYLQLVVAYGLVMVGCLIVSLILMDRAWEYDEPTAEDEVDVPLELPMHEPSIGGYWLQDFDINIVAISRAIAEGRKELRGLQAEPAPVLNSWERFCLECQRVYPLLVWMVPLFVVTAALAVAALAAAGFVALLLGINYARLISPTPIGIFPPNITPEARGCLVLILMAVGIFLLICLAARGFSMVNDGALRKYRQWLVHHDTLIPQLKIRIEQLENELGLQKRKRSEAVELHRTTFGSSF